MNSLLRRSDFQAVYGFSVYQVGIDNFVNVRFIDVGVPDAFRVYHAHRAFFAAVEATRLVDTHFARAGQTQFLNSPLGIFPDFRRTAQIAARSVRLKAPIINTEKNMFAVMVQNRFRVLFSALRK